MSDRVCNHSPSPASYSARVLQVSDRVCHHSSRPASYSATVLQVSDRPRRMVAHSVRHL